MRKLMSFLCQEEEGATMVEYGLMIALIAVVVVGAVYGIGSGLKKGFTNINEQVQTATSGL